MPKLRRTVSCNRCSSGVTNRCVSSKTTNVSLPPSFEVAFAVTGRMRPPSGRNVLVNPTSRPEVEATGPCWSMNTTASYTLPACVSSVATHNTIGPFTRRPNGVPS